MFKPCSKKGSAAIALILISVMTTGVACSPEPKKRRYKELSVTADQRTAPSSAETAVPAKPGANISLQWTLPEGWFSLPADGMRIATFKNKNADSPVECSVVSIPGGAGGIKANVRRWMEQLKLPPLSEEAADRYIAGQEQIRSAGGLLVQLVDFGFLQKEGPASDPSLHAAIVTASGQTFFFKMTGTKVAVRENRDPFLLLCRSLRENA